MQTHHTTCNCGAVKLEIRGERLFQFCCHCDDCQAVHGGACVPVMMLPVDAVKVGGGETTAWQRMVTPRHTCAKCGARRFAEPPDMGVRGVIAHPLPPERFHPTCHGRRQHAVMPARNGLPHHKGFPTVWGGLDETVAW